MFAHWTENITITVTFLYRPHILFIYNSFNNLESNIIYSITNDDEFLWSLERYLCHIVVTYNNYGPRVKTERIPELGYSGSLSNCLI